MCSCAASNVTEALSLALGVDVGLLANVSLGITTTPGTVRAVCCTRFAALLIAVLVIAGACAVLDDTRVHCVC